VLGGRDLAIVGAGAGLTVLDAEGHGRVIDATEAETLDLVDLTLTGGRSGRGGLLYSRNGTLTFDDVAFTDGVATEGGGVYLYGADLVGDRVTMAGNFAGMRTGALFVTQSSVVDFTRSLFAENRAPEGQGGALRALSISTVTYRNCVFSDNLATEGGAVYAEGSGTLVTLDHVTATLNEALSYGAVARSKSTADIVAIDSLFTLNRGPSILSDISSPAGYHQTYTLVDGNDATIETIAMTVEDPVDGVDGNLIDNGYAADLVSVTDDGDWTNDDWGLLPTSDAIDAGDPLGPPDADSTPPDLGATGGPEPFLPLP
jgi:predicted outer membrane repeat protein